MNAQQKLEQSVLELQQDIYRYFGKLGETEEFRKRKVAQASQKVKNLEAQLRQAEEREGQLNNEWAPIEVAREQSLRKIYENLMGQNIIFQKFEQQFAHPPQRVFEQKFSQSTTEVYDRVLSEQRFTQKKL